MNEIVMDDDNKPSSDDPNEIIPTTTTDEIEENFLRSCRNGDIGTVKQFLAYRDAKKVKFSVSCKGRSKYMGWTPLHLATYFGHRHVMECLLSRNADVNAINENGDTSLHKAAFIGRVDLVMLLLQHNADVCIINGEGRLPRDMTQTSDVGREISELLRAAEQTEILRTESKLLSASRDGDLDLLNNLLKDQKHPNINCVDAQGNSCLHCAAYRGHKETAVLLLQNGIDNQIRNHMGQKALELAKDPQMIQILSVKSVRRVQKSVNRFEGPLLRRSRFLGWRPVWAVLERGVLNYYASRADSTGINKNVRRDYKYLDSARISMLSTLASFIVCFSDGSMHRLSVVSNDEKALVERLKWVNAFQEHAAYSSHYLWGNERHRSDSDDDYETKAKPLGCMSDALASATASFEVIQRQLSDCVNTVEMLQRTVNSSNTMTNTTLSASVTSVMHFQTISETAANMVSSLQHCLTLFHQQEDIRVLQLKQEKEKCRVLEESLNILAKEHHQLEQSVASHLSDKENLVNHFIETDDDEYHDAFNDGEESDDDDTLVTASVFNSTTESLQDLNSIPIAPYEIFSYNSKHDTFHTAPKYTALKENHKSATSSDDDGDSDDTLVDGVSIASSCNTYVSEGGDAYISARDEFSFANDMNKEMTVDSLLEWNDNGGANSNMMRECKIYGRTSLPSPMFSRNDFSIWAVLKNCIGKELSNITMPVIFNEPLSFLQRMTEYMEYARLLRIASEQDDPVERMKYVAGFAVSALASNWERLGKPFNPLLGETYEYQNDDFRIICEQVSHHPPVSAFHADSPHFKFSGSIHPKLKFWGKSVEIQPKGVVTVQLTKWNEAYTWTNVNCCVHNIIVGKMWIEQYGTMEIVNKQNGLKAVLTFKPAGWASKDLHRVEGTISNKNDKNLRFIYGKWTEFIKCTDYESYVDYLKENAHKFRRNERSKSPNDSPVHTPRKVLSKLNSLKMSSFRSLSIQEPEESSEPSDGDLPKCDSTYSIDIPHSITIWEAQPRPPNTSEFYQFTFFAMSLNEMPPDIKPPQTLCPTDSRLRPDIRKLETGDIDGAAIEKTRLEEKQRDARKGMKARKEEWKPKWFTSGINPHTNLTDWIFNGDYWERNYVDLDIF